MADVRFLILVGPPSPDPSRMDFPPFESPQPLEAAPAPDREPSTRRTAVRRRPEGTGELIVAAADGWFAWRLMASNNRRLARSVTSFASRQWAVQAITQLRSDLEQLEPLVTTDPRTGSWGWRAERGGVPVAVCPHPYERERDRRGGFRRFVEAALRAGGPRRHDPARRARTCPEHVRHRKAQAMAGQLTRPGGPALPDPLGQTRRVTKTRRGRADLLFRGVAGSGGALVLVIMVLVGTFLAYRAWGALPFTGAYVLGPLVGAVVLLAVGAVLTTANRRRRRHG